MEKKPNVNSFGDYCVDKEKEELKKIKRSINPNTPDTQKYPRNSKYKFNHITRKMDDLTADIIDDKLNAIEEVDESKINESSIDQDILHNITKLLAYNKLKEDFRKSIKEFTDEVNSSDSGYDEGDTDHNLAFNAAIKEAIDELVAW